MNTQTIITLIGILSSVTLIISALSTNKTRLLTFSLITTSLVVTQFSITGAMVGLGVATVNFARIGTVLLSQKWGWLNHWGFIPFFLFIQFTVFYFMNDWNDLQPYNFVPVIASIFSITAIFFKNLIYTKILLILAGSFWLYYEFTTGVYGHMIGETATIVANTIALIVLVKAARKGIQASDPIAEFVDRITTSIPVITKQLTKSIPVITQTVTLPKGNKISDNTGSAPIVT